MTTPEFKLIAAAFIFGAGLLGALFALRLQKLEGRETVTRLANTFAGGVFLGAGLIHMFGDAEEKFAEAWPGVEFPVVALLVGFGFLMILLLDKVLITVSHHSSEAYSSRGAVYPYVLMLALSVHSIITGVALGLEDHVVLAAAILIAVLAHKSTATMALTISFARGQVAQGRARNLILLFCLTTPLGVMLGMSGASFLSGQAELMAEGLFDALAAGTFLYIAVVNILSEELASGGARLPLFIMTMLGFGGMALLAVWT